MRRLRDLWQRVRERIGLRTERIDVVSAVGDGDPLAHERLEYAGPFVDGVLEALAAVLREPLVVNGKSVALDVETVRVDFTPPFQQVGISLLAARAEEARWDVYADPSARFEKRVSAFPEPQLFDEVQLQAAPSPTGSAWTQVRPAEKFFYTFTSELTVDQNLAWLRDYIERRFEQGLEQGLEPG